MAMGGSGISFLASRPEEANLSLLGASVEPLLGMGVAWHVLLQASHRLEFRILQAGSGEAAEAGMLAGAGEATRGAKDAAAVTGRAVVAGARTT